MRFIIDDNNLIHLMRKFETYPCFISMYQSRSLLMQQYYFLMLQPRKHKADVRLMK